MSDLHIFARDDRFRVASWKSVVLLIVKTEWTMAGVRAWGKAIDFTIQKSPAGYACITILEETASTLQSAESRAFMHIVRTKTKTCAGSAFVIEGTGFDSATKRSVAASVNFLARNPFPNRTFSEPVGAIDWLTPHIPQFHQAPIKRVELDVAMALTNRELSPVLAQAPAHGPGLRAVAWPA